MSRITNILLPMIFPLVFLVSAFSQTAQIVVGYSGVETDSINLYSWSEFDASSLPAVVHTCQGNGGNPPVITCHDYQSSASASVSLQNPGGQVVSASQSGLTYLDAEVSVPLPATDGSIYNSTAQTAYSCGGSFYGGILNIQIETATTLLKMRPIQTPPAGTCDPGIAQCRYDVMSWCTPETTPPDNNPTGVVRVQFATYPTYWFSHALCERLGPGFTWTCYGFTLGGHSAPDDFPKVACTKTP